MGIGRVVLANPRVFAAGLLSGVLLIALGFMAAVWWLAPVGRAQTQPSVVQACVSLYTGAVRMTYPGASANCKSHEFLVELGAGDPAKNLTYVVRTQIHDNLGASGSSTRILSCLPGETALNGGVLHRVDDQYEFGSFEPGIGGPVGSPPTGWRVSYAYSGSPSGVGEVWILCVS